MNLLTIHGVRGYIDNNGTAQLNLEDVSRGLGFTQKAASGNEVVRWERVNKYLTELNFVPTSGDAQYIPENIFYRLAMKAKNETAENFQTKVADEILPSIRKHGAYMTPQALEAALTNPDTMIQILTRLKEEQSARAAAEQKIQLDAPKVALYDTAMSASNDFTMERVSKTLGYGRNKLFQFLRDQKILRSNNLPYQEYIDRGYFNVRQYSITHLTQGIENKTQTLVTPKGMAYIHELLRKHGKLPAA